MLIRPVPAEGLALTKRWESFVPVAKPDPIGIPTIGYGSIRWPDGRHVQNGEGPITEERASEMLLDHMHRLACPSVLRLITVPLTDEMYAALVDFTYNLGGGALQASTLRSKLNRGDEWGALMEFGKWVYAGGRKLRGLVLRRRAEQEMFLYGMEREHFAVIRKAS